MIVEQDILKRKEIYEIEENDELEIKKGKSSTTTIYINGKKIELVSKIILMPGEKPSKTVKLEVERYFTQEDFDEIKKYYE